MDRKRLGSFVLGGLAGLIAGILIAPKSGRETRGTIVNRAGEARQQSSESYFEARERISERISSVREKTPSPGPHVAGSRGVDPDEAPRRPEPPRPVLRDVSKDANEDPAPDPSNRSEALRRKVRETREKLREVTNEEKPEKEQHGDEK